MEICIFLKFYYIKILQKWIGNENKRKKICTDSEPPPKPVKIPTGSRGSHSYNVFCSEYFKSGTIVNIIFLCLLDSDWLKAVPKYLYSPNTHVIFY